MDKSFLTPYLYIAFVFGLLDLADSLISLFDFPAPPFRIVMIFIAAAFFFFNLLAISFFYHHGVNKQAYILPVYHLLVYALFGIVGFIVTYFNLLSRDVVMILVITGILSALFEITLSLLLLKNLVFKAAPRAKLHIAHSVGHKFV